MRTACKNRRRLYAGGLGNAKWSVVEEYPEAVTQTLRQNMANAPRSDRR